MSALTLLHDSQPPWLLAASVGATVLLWLGFQTLGFPGRLRKGFQAEDVKSPEKRFGYSPAELASFAEKIGPKRLGEYRRGLVWDLLFAVLLGAFLLLLIDGIFIRSLDASQGRAWWLLWLPALYAICDVGEDLLLRAAINPANIKPPDPGPNAKASLVSSGAASRASKLTRMKFLFVGASILVLVAGAVNLALFGPRA